MKQTCYSNYTQAFMKKTIFKFLNFKSLNFFRMKQSCNPLHPIYYENLPLIINH